MQKRMGKNFTHSTFAKLVETYPKRHAAVIAVKGPTRYWLKEMKNYAYLELN